MQIQGLIITAAIFCRAQPLSPARCRHPPDRAGEAGNGRDGLRDMVAAVMIKPQIHIVSSWHDGGEIPVR